MQAYEYLKQVKYLDSLIEDSREVEEEIWSQITGITQANDGMPHATGVSDKIGNTMPELLAARERTVAAIAEYVEAREDVINHLKMLPRKQYEVLNWLFVKKRANRKKGQKRYYTWSEVAENLGCSEEAMRKTRRRAIKNLQKILDSEGEK